MTSNSGEASILTDFGTDGPLRTIFLVRIPLINRHDFFIRWRPMWKSSGSATLKSLMSGHSPVSICNKCSFWAETWKLVHVRFDSKYFILIWLMVVTSFAYCEIILERFYLKIEPCFIPFHVPALTYSNIWFGLFTISWNSLF